MSTIPAALDALVAMWRGALGDQVQVCDGQPDEWLRDQLVVVGWTIEQLSVTSTNARESAGTDDRERYDINCYANAFSGDRSMKDVRDTVWQLYRQLVATLRADQRLGGVVMRARPRVLNFDQVRVDGGAEFTGGVSATVEFSVACDAFAR